MYRSPMPAGIDFRRYRKLRRFVTRVFLQVVWWDVVLNVPGLRRFRRPPLVRYQEIARRYRALAGEMGGVLIKLGQFLSTRVDILPPEITRELAGLQDEVPPERFADVVRQIEEDFGRPLAEVFPWISPEPVGAASLAQVHAARLPTGEEVVVKVLRPGIDVLVETDLAAVRLATRLLRFSKTIRRRVDLGRLGAEITATTRAELDLAAEGRNAERFAANFAGDDAGLSAQGLLGVERPPDADAGERRLDQDRRPRGARPRRHLAARGGARPLPGLSAADLRALASCMPIPTRETSSSARCRSGTSRRSRRAIRCRRPAGRRGAAVPDRVRRLRHGGGHPRAAARRAARVRDRPRHARRRAAGPLLRGRRRAAARGGPAPPGGGPRGAVRSASGGCASAACGRRRSRRRSTSSAQYRDILYELPFQVQVDLLFASRAVGLLAGLSTQLDPEFDPWAETLPFAERLAAAGAAARLARRSSARGWCSSRPCSPCRGGWTPCSPAPSGGRSPCSPPSRRRRARSSSGWSARSTGCPGRWSPPAC